VIECPKCRSTFEEQVKFCNQCGYRFTVYGAPKPFGYAAGMILAVIGIIWAVIGAGDIVMGFAKMGTGHELLATVSLIFNFMVFIFPGLVLAGIGALMRKKQTT
jgi:hypothetical protein